MSKEVEFKIGPDGKIDMEMLGFHGEGCAKEARKLTDRLGLVTDSDQKSEFYESDCEDKQEDHERHGY